MLSCFFVRAEEKILPDRRPVSCETSQSVAKDERAHFQLALYTDERIDEIRVTVDSALGDRLTWREVICVPCTQPFWHTCDDYYISRSPFLCPDVLKPRTNPYCMRAKTWSSLWFTVDGKRKAGDYPITVRLESRGKVVFAGTYTLHVGNFSLGESSLICTDWFHYDAIAQYYRVPVFSRKFNSIVDDFIRHAVGHGINMILVPLFTPPLDTRVGGERLTVQLVDVTKTADGGYSFGFDRLLAFLARIRKLGVRHFEMSHLFTQWGAAHAPKIIATTPQGKKMIFGWETDSQGEEYKAFLGCFLPALKAALVASGDWDDCWFHVSDEPNANNLATYTAAHDTVVSAVPDIRLMDAASDIQYLDSGLIRTPIPSTGHITPFLEREVPGLWTYYCCSSQDGYLSNRFMAMPGERTRVLGFQMYLNRIVGFLHWGYNFYNSVLSDRPIDPYLTTDADGAFPSGDAFSVYPGADGKCLDSLRLELFHGAIQDRTLCLKLEEKRGRDFVESILLDAGFGRNFGDYPKDAAILSSLRRRLHDELEAR